MSLLIHHLGIVVSDSQTEANRYADLFKSDFRSESEEVLSQKVKICLIKNNSIYLEFIEPTDNKSPVYNFLLKGGGFHHICYEIDDIYSGIDILRPYGILINEPVIGFQNRMTAFVWSKSDILGVRLIELAEKIKN